MYDYAKMYVPERCQYAATHTRTPPAHLRVLDLLQLPLPHAHDAVYVRRLPRVQLQVERARTKFGHITW